MRKIDKSEYGNYIKQASECRANQVYPMSVAQGTQSGDIYTNENGVILFRHYAGFAYISGNADREFLEDIYHCFFCGAIERRFLLVTDDGNVIGHFKDMEDLRLSRRVEYRYAGKPEKRERSAGCYAVEEISPENIGCIRGRIVPAFSWDSQEAFLEKGFGYIARDGDRFAAVAFSSALSSTQVDIGVETDIAYRNQGLASILSEKMCEEIIRRGKSPVWAHAQTNEGSGRTAAGAGFVPYKVNTVIQRA